MVKESISQGARDSARGRAARIHAALVVAILGLIAWYVLVALRRPTLIADEHYHVMPIQALAAGDWGPALALPMPPAYHLLASLAVRLCGGDLRVIRAFNTLLAILTVVLFHVAARTRGPDYGPHDLLRFAGNPLLLPYWVLVYTDAAALLAVVLALNFHLRRRYLLAAGGLLTACLIRQSNVVWVALFIALGAVALWNGRPRARAALRAALPRFLLREVGAALWPYLLVLAGGMVFLTFHLGPAPVPQVENQPRFNLAQLYLFALTGGLLWAPVWLAQLGCVWPRRFEPALLRPAVCAAVIALVGVLAVAFSNPHPWNLDLSFLRNWPLYAMTKWLPARFLAGLCIVAFGATLVQATWRSPAQAALGFIWLFALLFVMPHYLADPRYYIIPIVLLDFYTPYTATQARRLTGWYLVLTVGVALFIVGRSGGGVW